MPNEAPSQEIKQEIHESPQVTNETKIDNPYSTYFSNPEISKKIQDQVNTYKNQNPNIEKNFANYLSNNTDLVKTRNSFLEKNIGDSERCKKIINTMIDASIKEEVPVTGEQNKDIQTTKPIDKIESQITIPKIENMINIKQESTNKIQESTNKIQESTNKIQDEKIENKKYSESLKKRFQEVEEQRQSLITKHPSLDINLSDAKNKVNLNPNTLKILSDKGVPAETVDKYILFKATQEAIQADPSIKDADTFLLSFKKLENELNIPDTKIQDLSAKNVEQISSQIFNPDTGNQNLIKTIAENKQAHAEDFEKLFDAPKDIKELNDMYGKFLPESQNKYNAIADKQQSQSPLTQTEQDFLNRFKTELEAKKTEFETSTSDTMEQATILGPIMGLADYMDVQIGQDFAFNKSNDIQIRDGILSMSGNIDNKPFTLETNLDKASKLKTSDYLNKTDEKNMNVGNSNRQETPYVMPGQKEIRDHIKTQTQENHSNILNESKSLNEYQNTLKQSLCDNVKSLYGYKELVQIRMEKQMTKNVAAQETLDMFNTSIAKDFFNDGKNIGENESPALRNFLTDLDYSLENLSADEIKLRKDSIQEFTKILKDPAAKQNSKILQAISPDMIKQTQKNMQKISSGEDTTTPNIFDFFNCVKDPKTKTFQVNEFHNLLQENKKPEPNEKAFPHIAESRNKNNADVELEMAFIEIEETIETTTTIEYTYA